MQETHVWSLGWEDALEKDMATLSSFLAKSIPWIEDPGRLQSMGSGKSQTWLSDWHHGESELQLLFLCTGDFWLFWPCGLSGSWSLLEKTQTTLCCWPQMLPGTHVRDAPQGREDSSVRACPKWSLNLQIPKWVLLLELPGLGKLMSTDKCVSSDNIQSALGFLHQWSKSLGYTNICTPSAAVSPAAFQHKHAPPTWQWVGDRCLRD